MIQAALGISQLTKLNKFVKERNLIANYYRKKLIHKKILFQELIVVHVLPPICNKILGKNNKNLRNKIHIILKRVCWNSLLSRTFATIL